MNQSERQLYLLRSLLAERPEYHDIAIPDSPQQQWLLLRALMNVRPASPISPEFQKIQDQFLQKVSHDKEVVDSGQFAEGLSIWQGDITRLGVDTIVNAANSGMTGCYLPNHNCIDNAIHTFAGIELRLYCDKLMEARGHPEQTGKAKITPAYNLPSKYVIHTVGPVVEADEPTEENCNQLAESYHNCLELAAKHNLTSIAFPCISTGVFHFPNGLAAQIAVKTCREFLTRKTSIKKAIFDVFKDEDKQIYEQLLG